MSKKLEIPELVIEQIKDLYNKKYTRDQIHDEINKTYKLAFGGLVKIINRLKLPRRAITNPNDISQYNPNTLEKIKEMFMQGFSENQIMSKIDMKPKKLHNHLTILKLNLKEFRNRSEIQEKLKNMFANGENLNTVYEYFKENNPELRFSINNIIEYRKKYYIPNPILIKDKEDINSYDPIILKKIKKMYEEGKTYIEMAKILQTKQYVIQNYLHIQGLRSVLRVKDPYDPNCYDSKLIENLKKLHSHGYGKAYISNKLKITRTRVEKLFTGLDLKNNRKILTEDDNWDDPKIHIKRIISSSIRASLKTRNTEPDLRAFDVLGYTLDDIKNHIENYFKQAGNEWMHWNNWRPYNKDIWDDNDCSTWVWHLDHIIPHSEFKYTSMKDDSFKKCWSLSNLRPYSAKQNIIDGSTRVRHKK